MHGYSIMSVSFGGVLGSSSSLGRGRNTTELEWVRTCCHGCPFSQTLCFFPQSVAALPTAWIAWWCHLRRFRSSGRWRWPASSFAFAPVFGCVAYGIGLRGGVTCAGFAARADGDGRSSFSSPRHFHASCSMLWLRCLRHWAAWWCHLRRLGSPSRWCWPSVLHVKSRRICSGHQMGGCMGGVGVGDGCVWQDRSAHAVGLGRLAGAHADMHAR